MEIEKEFALGTLWLSSLNEAHDCLKRFLQDTEQLQRCEQFSRLLTETLRKGGHVLSCGNGGSHCDALHFAEELTGRYRKDRRPLGALALGEATHASCVSNDYGADKVFARQVEALGRPGDLLLGLSTSGNSANLLRAFKAGRRQGLKCVALLGREGGALKDLADLAVIVPGETSDRIQELHIKILHIVIETVERELFPENYAPPKPGT